MSTDTISRCAAVMDLIDAYVGSQTSANRHAIRSALLALASAPAQSAAAQAEAKQCAYCYGTGEMDDPDFGLIACHKCAGASSQPEAKAQAVPIGYMSHQQVVLIEDRDNGAGVYIPMRRTKRGNFTMALYAAPQPPATSEQREPLSHERVAVRNPYQHSPSLSAAWLNGFRSGERAHGINGEPT